MPVKVILSHLSERLRFSNLTWPNGFYLYLYWKITGHMQVKRWNISSSMFKAMRSVAHLCEHYLTVQEVAGSNPGQISRKQVIGDEVGWTDEKMVERGGDLGKITVKQQVIWKKGLDNCWLSLGAGYFLYKSNTCIIDNRCWLSSQKSPGGGGWIFTSPLRFRTFSHPPVRIWSLLPQPVTDPDQVTIPQRNHASVSRPVSNREPPDWGGCAHTIEPLAPSHSTFFFLGAYLFFLDKNSQSKEFHHKEWDSNRDSPHEGATLRPLSYWSSSFNIFFFGQNHSN